MQIVILFGGGDAGGFIITAHGIKPIPPFPADVLYQLKAVNSLTRIHGDHAGELGEVAARLSNTVVAHVEKATGAQGASVLFLDGDDGFYCGNGKKPIPVPIPHGFSQAAVQAA